MLGIKANKAMKYLGLFYFILLLLQPLSCSKQDARQASAQFDQSLVPVLFYASYGECEKALAELEVLQWKWTHYKSTLPKEDVSYSDGFATIPEYVESKFGSLAGHLRAEQVPQSIWDIYDIQCALSDWRRGAQVDYYLDEWYEFKQDVDIFTTMAEDDLLNLCDWEEVEWQYEYLSSSFYFINANVRDLDLFGINADQFQERLVEISHSLSRLEEAMQTGQRNRVEDAAHILKKDVMDTMAYFGRFSGTVAGL